MHTTDNQTTTSGSVWDREGRDLRVLWTVGPLLIRYPAGRGWIRWQFRRRGTCLYVDDHIRRPS